MKQLHYLSLCATNLAIFVSFWVVAPVTLAESVSGVEIAQSAADYQNAMQLGYKAASEQDFNKALENFKRALKFRPGDRNAQIAIDNINQYLKEGNRLHVTPSGVGAPNVRSRGATRQKNCLNGRKLVAMIPEKQLVLTSLAQPTLLFYIPTTSAKSLQMRFEDDSTGIKFYEKTLTTPAKPGFFRLSFAELNNTPSLELAKTYRQ